jgi:hypothetical protein
MLPVLSAPRYAVAGALFRLFCCSFSGRFSILATCPNFGEQFSPVSTPGRHGSFE